MTDFRERTDEFAAIASVISQQRKQNGSEARKRHESPSSSGTELAARTHFTMLASELGKDIHRTSEKLQKLAGCLFLFFSFQKWSKLCFNLFVCSVNVVV